MPSKIFINYFKQLLLISIFISPIICADELRIPIGQQAQDKGAMDMPIKGMSKERVRSLFGNPIEEAPDKGTPPISRWKYQEFTVYFDTGAVIHSVRNFQPKASSSASTDQNKNGQNSTN